MRFLWVAIYITILFLKSSTNVIDYVFDGILICSLVYQTIRCLISLNKGHNKRTFSAHKQYFISKIIFVFTNFVDLVLKQKIKCSNDESLQNCFQTSIDEAYMVNTIWTMLDIYWLVIIYSFCIKVHLGVYTPIGGTFIRSDSKEGLIAINLESIGFKVKKTVEPEASFPIKVETERKVNKKKKFRKITPFLPSKK